MSVVGKEDIQRLFQLGIDISPGKQDANLRLLHSTIETYSLNSEQQRAFCIAARHLHHHERDPLRMYLGGMGGTGKSRVLLAIMGFLMYRDEAHRFIVLGPTGGSAALVGGSTYHSVLGFGFKKNGELTNAAAEKIRDRLACVDLIFIDEVSMISCVELNRISKALCEVFRNILQSFGGKSVILSGDFAQLPPVSRGGALYSRPKPNSKNANRLADSQKNQNALFGLTIWHSFTTVIILCQNMRQSGQSKEDLAFRACLANMRYTSCTPADIALLTSRIIDSTLNRVDQISGFEDVSVITARNSH